MRTVFDGSYEMPSKAILKPLCELEEAPWNDLKGKPLDERELPYRLKQYEVKSKTLSVGQSRPKGYTREDLHDAWERYLPPATRHKRNFRNSATAIGFRTSKA